MKLPQHIVKPNLFIVGASKCATTSLWDILRRHPDIFLSNPKEPSWFVRDDYQEQILSYLALFQNADGESIVGEASPVYSETLQFPEVPKRIYDFNPGAKIIYMVRNPADRLVSVWKQTLSTGHWYRDAYQENFGKEVGPMPLDFEKAVFIYPSFLEACRYWTHLNNYLKVFPADQIHLAFYEDFRDNPEQLLNGICRFLQVDSPAEGWGEHIVRPRNRGENKTRYRNWYARLNESKKQQLKRFLPPILLNRLVSKKIRTRHLLSKKLKRRIEEELSDENRRILEYGGKPADFWE